MSVRCDAPQCRDVATWLVGELDETDRVIGHPCCDYHVAQAARVTFVQLEGESLPESLTLWPASMIVGTPKTRVARIHLEST